MKIYSEKQIASLTIKTVNNNKTSCEKDSGSDRGVRFGSGEAGGYAHVCAGAQRPEGDFHHSRPHSFQIVPY